MDLLPGVLQVLHASRGNRASHGRSIRNIWDWAFGPFSLHHAAALVAISILHSPSPEVLLS